MQLRKICPDKIFDGYRFLEEHVLIISEDGVVEGLMPSSDVDGDIEIFSGLLTPGFVNCHCHLELSHMRGTIPEKTGLVDFVFKVVTERDACDEEILVAIAVAENEMKKAGIVAVGDICNNTSTLTQKSKANLLYYNFIEASGWLPAVSEARFERARALLQVFNEAHAKAESENSTANWQLPTANFSIVPHAPYSVSENLWKEIQPYYSNKVVSIHNQETKFEDELFLSGGGDFVRMYEMMKIDTTHHLPTKKSSLQSYYNQLLVAQKIILVHNTFTKQEDINFVNQQSATRQPQTFFCLCVNANQYIENVVPPIELFRKNKCSIVLGTDSLASNWSLSILDELKTIRKNFPGVPLEEMLRWATSNGARALGMEGQIGSFENGKKPGGVLISEADLKVENILF